MHWQVSHFQSLNVTLMDQIVSSFHTDGAKDVQSNVFVVPSAYGLTGLSRGGQQVSKCKEVFGKAVKLLVELASLQVCSPKDSVSCYVLHVCWSMHRRPLSPWMK